MIIYQEKKKIACSDSIEKGDRNIHPATIKLGLLYRQGLVQEDDDRVAALIAAFCNIIRDYTAPPNKQLSWDLDKHIRNQVQYLVDCRQHSMGMGNVIKFIRATISQINPDMSESDVKKDLLQKLLSYMEERITFAQENIIRCCLPIIRDGDVILTFGSSTVIRQLLLSASKIKSFRLIIVDTRPLNEGLRTLRELSPKIQCIYTPLSGAASAMRDVSRVFLGASALLSNGAMIASAGTAMIASLAKAQRIPVIVATQSYKFCEKVQLDAIVYNELGSPHELVSQAAIITGEDITFSSNSSLTDKQQSVGTGASSSSLLQDYLAFVPELSPIYKGAADVLPLNSSAGNSVPGEDEATQKIVPSPAYQVINLRYDLTPIENISVVATEIGLIPPTSIPVLIRELRGDQLNGNN